METGPTAYLIDKVLLELRTKRSTPESDESGTWSKDIIKADLSFQNW